MSERTFQCRRNKACRAWLPESSIDWKVENGQRRAYCQPGMCPQGKRSDTSEDLLALQLEARKLRADTRDAKASAERALTRLEVVQKALDTALEIRDIIEPPNIPGPEDPAAEEATPLLAISDIHCGMRVKSSAVNGLGEFNEDIFDERLDSVFCNAVKVVNAQRSSEQSIKQGIVWLGGDMIEGELHPDAIQNQSLTTTQQLVRCELALVRGFNYLLAHSDFERIIVPCNVGNHDRNTKKQQSNSTENSYAWMMYHNLRRHFKSESRLEWFIADSDCLYMNVYDKTIRFFHGDSVKYNGGAAGPLWNVMKHCKNLDQTIPADHTVHGHFHTLGFGSRATSNGSLPSVAPYGHNQGYTYEPPQQAMRFLHSTRGFTGCFPIFAD
jgi:hypothetical protein